MTKTLSEKTLITTPVGIIISIIVFATLSSFAISAYKFDVKKDILNLQSKVEAYEEKDQKQEERLQIVEEDQDTLDSKVDILIEANKWIVSSLERIEKKIPNN